MCQVSEPNFKALNMTIETFQNLIEQNLQLIKVNQGMENLLLTKTFLR